MISGKELRATFAPRSGPTRMLLAAPDRFEVAYAINAHMTDAEGRLRVVDRELAVRQWDALRKAYEAIGYPVDVVPAVEGFPDLVFAANQSFPFRRTDGSRAALLSRMRHPERQGEVAIFADWFAAQGIATVTLPADAGFLEGAGDLLWHPGLRLLYGGHGFRSTPTALEAAAAAIDAPLVALKLTDPRFYHLDTALVPLDAERALVVREAFDAEGLSALADRFDELVFVPEAEAAEKFAGNAHCPDGRNVLIEAACTAARRLLSDRGFRVRPLETSEFRKAGGSVFCLKAALD
jgi:N-dimethylarginine dimethylaminohydrolase